MQVDSATDAYVNPSGAAGKQVKSLDKDAFLTLFVEQLKNQDPTSPLDSSAMLNQMAQFSMVEQLTNISESIAQIKLSQQIGEATMLLGKQVKVQTDDGEITGQVEKETINGQDIRIFINGKGYEMDQVTEIK